MFSIKTPFFRTANEKNERFLFVYRQPNTLVFPPFLEGGGGSKMLKLKKFQRHNGLPIISHIFYFFLTIHICKLEWNNWLIFFSMSSVTESNGWGKSISDIIFWLTFLCCCKWMNGCKACLLLGRWIIIQIWAVSAQLNLMEVFL